jgi:hypothetical protein
MQLRKNQIACVKADNIEMLSEKINISRNVLDKFTQKHNSYDYNINADFDNLVYNIFMWKIKGSN